MIPEQIEATAEILRIRVRLFLQSINDYLGTEPLPTGGVFRLLQRLLNADRDERDNASLKDSRKLVEAGSEWQVESPAKSRKQTQPMRRHFHTSKTSILSQLNTADGKYQPDLLVNDSKEALIAEPGQPFQLNQDWTTAHGNERVCGLIGPQCPMKEKRKST